jgi:hypothetical protein
MGKLLKEANRIWELLGWLWRRGENIFFGTVSKNYIGGRERMKDEEICWVFEEKDQEVGFILRG